MQKTDGNIFASSKLNLEEMASDKALKSSPAWSCFDVDEKLEQKAICRLCQAKVSFSSNRKSRPNSKEVCTRNDL